jgi:hypothetical protein
MKVESVRVLDFSGMVVESKKVSWPDGSCFSYTVTFESREPCLLLPSATPVAAWVSCVRALLGRLRIRSPDTSVQSLGRNLKTSEFIVVPRVAK